VRALDTNVLVRFLVNDDPAQHQRAVAAIEKARTLREPLYVGDVVLAEVVWVLQRRYRVAKPAVIEALRGLVASRELTFSSRERVADAVGRFTAGSADFADYLIAAEAREAGHDVVLTFDNALLNEAGFEAPGAER